MKIKIDLHTHCSEATGDSLPKVETVKKIIDMIKEKGLDGIAVTDHDDKEYGFRLKEIADQRFPGEAIIIPGQEIHVLREHVVELFLDNGGIFRFCAHPFFGAGFEEFLEKEGGNIHGIELKNSAWQLKEEKVKEIAEIYNLILLENSDAHSLNEIGLHYNMLELEELYSHCKMATL